MATLPLLFLGDGGVGKSAIITRYVHGKFVIDYDPTIENSFRKQVDIDGHVQMLEIMDTAGQEEYKTLRDGWIRNGKGFIIVFDLTNRDSFLPTVREDYDKVLDVCGVDTVPCCIVGNKSDLVADRVVKKTEAEELAKNIGAHYVETSAKMNVNIQELFEWIVREVRKHDKPKAPPSTGTLTDSKGNKTLKCVLF